MVFAVVIKACVDFEVGIGGFEVTREGLKIIKLLLEVGAEEETADLYSEIGHEAGVGRPGVLVRVVMT